MRNVHTALVLTAPETGFDATGASVVGLLFLAGGATLLWGSRRRS